MGWMRRIRVLLADDAPAYRSLLRLALEDDGRFTVVGEVGDGAQAVEAVDAERPDILLLDLAMPVMDGLQTIPHVRRCCPSTRIVVLSAFSRGRVGAEVESAGASAYLEKSTPPETIAKTLVDLVAA
jgi:DNA-binding NarL/FixJ family response regulator